jgi:hypothetical protein
VLRKNGQILLGLYTVNPKQATGESDGKTQVVKKILDGSISVKMYRQPEDRRKTDAEILLW